MTADPRGDLAHRTAVVAPVGEDRERRVEDLSLYVRVTVAAKKRTSHHDSLALSLADEVHEDVLERRLDQHRSRAPSRPAAASRAATSGRSAPGGPMSTCSAAPCRYASTTPGASLEHAERRLDVGDVHLEDLVSHRPGLDLARRALGDDAAAVDEREPVAVGRLVHVVRGDEERDARLRRARRAAPRSGAAPWGRRRRSARRGRAAPARGSSRSPARAAASSPTERFAVSSSSRPTRSAILEDVARGRSRELLAGRP